MEEALYLTKFARKVTIIHRRDELRAAKSIQVKAFANPKIAFLWDSVVEEVGGDGLLQTMTVKNVKTGELTKIEADPKDGLFGLFGFIGMIPNTGVFADKVETDDKGYIKTDEDMHTNVPGVYAVGDVRVKSLAPGSDCGGRWCDRGQCRWREVCRIIRKDSRRECENPSDVRMSGGFFASLCVL